jgi:sarcosine oxidase subunit delta
VHAERWIHQHGCQRWFNAIRETASDRILQTYMMGEKRPDRSPPQGRAPAQERR